MKKLVTICLLVFFTISGNAQWYHRQFNVSNINELNQKQLNLALEKSMQTIKTGQIMTGVGVGLGIIGGVLLIDDMNKRHNSTGFLSGLPTYETVGGLLILGTGIITAGIEIPKWIIGSKRKADIEIELAKFNPKGSASINGIGLRIRF